MTIDKENFKYFVWVAGKRGAEPQVWIDKVQTRDGKPVPALTDPVRLRHDDKRSLDQLAKDYPYAG